ncbi:MAG: electron transfer flavoprotein subunit alpha/FixB family protein, partial [Alphaproteobacteria bacterium]
MTTLLLAESDNQSLASETGKALSSALAIGAPVHMLVAGDGVQAIAVAAAQLTGVDKVLVADDPSLAQRLAEPMAALVVSIADGYETFIAAATSTGKNVMPRVAALLDV